MILNEQSAWDVLDDKYYDFGGCIYKKDSSTSITNWELDAIKYLCEEWDYSFYPGDINGS